MSNNSHSKAWADNMSYVSFQSPTVGLKLAFPGNPCQLDIAISTKQETIPPNCQKVDAEDTCTY